MGPIGCPETSVTNYQCTLCNIPEEGRPYVHHGGSLKSCKVRIFSVFCVCWNICVLDCGEAGLPLIIWKHVLLIYGHPVKTYLYCFGKNTV